MTRFQGEKSKEKIRIIYPYSPLFSYVFIFFPCSDAAADMPLAEIFIQHFAHPRAERGIEFAQPFGDVLVYGGFARAKMRRASAHRATRRQYVLRVRTHALINIFPHLKSPPTVSFRLPRPQRPVLRYDLIYVEVCTFMYCILQSCGADWKHAFNRRRITAVFLMPWKQAKL